MKILIFGDIFGRIGRQAFAKHLNELKQKFEPDFVVANGENLSSGRGPIEKHVLEIRDLGVDLLTGGNHSFDNEKKIVEYMEKEESILLRPANFYEYYSKIPGKGYKVIEKNGKKLLVINLMSTHHMRDDLLNPFIRVDEILKEFNNASLDGIIVDFHRETTSEIQAMTFMLDGRVSFVYGTHTHVQTNDEIVFPKGTGMLTDVGMTGSVYSVIGADYKSVESRFLTGINKGKIDQSLDTYYVINGIFVEIEGGKTVSLQKIRVRGNL